MDGEQRECRNADYGECAKSIGTQTCVDGSWGPCEGAVLPAPEVCDGLDNDCDNEIDEPDRPDDEVCGACPWNVVEVAGTCVDRWKASHDPEVVVAAASLPDAEAWTGLSFGEARQACANAGKELCPPAVWQQACEGLWPDRQGAPGSGRLHDLLAGCPEWVRPDVNPAERNVMGGDGVACQDRRPADGAPCLGFRSCKELAP